MFKKIALALMFTVGSLTALADNTQTPPHNTTTEVLCLAQNVFFEARGEDLKGQLGVAMVTMKRVSDQRFENSVCKVIADGYVPGRRDCHFSWYCDGKPNVFDTSNPIEQAAWDHAKMIAEGVYHGYRYIEDPTNGADHYHSRKVSPPWAKVYPHTATLGAHLYYAWK